MPKLTVTSLLNQLRADLRSDTERGRMVRSAGMIAAMKVGATLLAFGASLLYARALGPHDYGLYAYVIAWTTILTIPAGLGLPQYLVREGAKAPESLNWLRRWADRRVIIASLIAAAFLACFFLIPAAADARWLFVIAAPLPLLNNLGSIRRSLLQTQGYVAQSQWPLLILAPAVMLAVLIGLWLWRSTLDPIEVLAAMVTTAFLPGLINEFQFRRAIQKSKNENSRSIKISTTLPFMWLGMLYLINSRADLIMLGTLKGAHDAGIYAVATRAAEFTTFFMMTVNIVIGPRIANLYHSGNYALLQRLLTGATRRAFILSTPVALLLIFAAHPLLRYFYGIAFVEGAIALQILVAAQFIGVMTGPKGLVLNMTGHEKFSTLSVGLSIGLNIVLNGMLIPLYSVNGAAIATSLSLVLYNLLLWYWVRRRLGLRPSILGT